MGAEALGHYGCDSNIGISVRGGRIHHPGGSLAHVPASHSAPHCAVRQSAEGAHVIAGEPNHVAFAGLESYEGPVCMNGIRSPGKAMLQRQQGLARVCTWACQSCQSTQSSLHKDRWM